MSERINNAPLVCCFQRRAPAKRRCNWSNGTRPQQSACV